LGDEIANVGGFLKSPPWRKTRILDADQREGCDKTKVIKKGSAGYQPGDDNLSDGTAERGEEDVYLLCWGKTNEGLSDIARVNISRKRRIQESYPLEFKTNVRREHLEGRSWSRQIHGKNSGGGARAWGVDRRKQPLGLPLGGGSFHDRGRSR